MLCEFEKEEKKVHTSKNFGKEEGGMHHEKCY